MTLAPRRKIGGGVEMAKGDKSRIRVGIGGWTYEPWRGVFYPAGLTQSRELEYASRKLNSIEINGTYYSLQKPATFAKWRDETPDDFVFALKGSRFITNRRVLAEAGEAMKKFFASGLSELGPKLGPMNWQFAATKRFDPEDFEAFLKLLPKSLDGLSLRHAVEVRHESFRSPDFIALLRKYDVAIIVAADSEYPQIADVTAPFVYVRIMGTSEKEEIGYSAKALDLWSKRAQDWASGGAPEGLKTVSEHQHQKAGRDVFLYVISGFKERNPAAAMALRERAGA
jgi:uncharacterized protein YecE (DUF72 family)